MGQTYQSIVIDAPIDRVWAAIHDFHDLSWAPNVITSVDAIGDRKGVEVGAKRVLNGVFHETLHELDDRAHNLAYRIDDGPSPVSSDDVNNYVGRLSARPITEGAGTFVEWSSTWERNDQAAGEFCHGIYVALLRDMKQSLEG
jgi:hypothetical protein